MAKSSIEWLESRIKNLIPNDRTSQRNFSRNIKIAKIIHKVEITQTYIAADSESTIENSQRYANKYYERTFNHFDEVGE